jgi:2-keto-3-deoxy-L-rhamnonate aldolase RhmA
MDKRFRAALLNRQVVLGSWLQINNATAAEVLANVGWDWIAIDI